MWVLNKSVLKKATLFLVAFFMSAIAGADTTDNQNSHIYLTLVDPQTYAPSYEALESFDCSEKIHSVVELTGYELGKYTLTILWQDPDQNIRERTEYNFHVRDKNVVRLWAWLSLSRAAGASMLQWLNPAAGYEEFIGNWEIDVLVNGQSIGKRKFQVSC